MFYSRGIAGSLIFVSVILTGCGGSDSDAGLSEVAGIWDSSGAGDVYYTVIPVSYTHLTLPTKA